MSKVVWSRVEKIVVLSAQRTLGSLIKRAKSERAEWVVLLRLEEWRDQPYMYAFRPSELARAARRDPAKLLLTAVEALDLRETGESRTAPPGVTPSLPAPDPNRPSASRAIRTDAQGEAVSVGEFQPSDTIDFIREHTTKADSPLLGSTRGKSGAGSPPVPEAEQRVEATLSATAPTEIVMGDEAVVEVQVGLSGATLNAAVATATTSISLREKITAIITVHGGTVEALNPRVLKLDPPQANAPSQSVFLVRGLMPGPARIAVIFRQGGTELGTLAFPVNVVVGASAPGPQPVVRATAPAAPRDEGDDDVLTLLIEEDRQGGANLRYRYRIVSSVLGMDYDEFFSDPLKSADGATAATARAYVEAVYRQITDRALKNADDLRAFERELRAIGTDLCRQLLPDDFARQLWAKRDDIGNVMVRSWEPYIPWELLRVRDPDAARGSSDERFLADYDLIRSLHGKTRPRRLALSQWSYLAAKYEFGYAKPVGAEVEYLTNELPSRHGIQPSSVEPSIDRVLDALGSPDFDVLHIACHGEAVHGDIDRSSLIIGDRPSGDGGGAPVSIEARTVRAEASLWERQPLVFLNACESGRSGASLTEWGGWPQTFWERGAGAFVGTSWAVRERPARAFAEGFYEALLEGKTLAQAGGAGRASAKKLGDASWLAYKVYGHPGARKL